MSVELKLLAVTKDFLHARSTIKVLHGVSATFEQGKTYAITAASGAGKSTLLHILVGIEKPTTGSITFNGKALSQFSAAEHAQFLNKNIGLVLQEPHLIQELTVLENVMLKGLIAGMDIALCKQKAESLLAHVGLADKALCKPSTLSGGQQQRVAILRALFNEPDFLIADEPTGNLDQETGRSLINFLIVCSKQWGMGLIISSHDAHVVHMMEHTLHLHEGVLVAGMFATKDPHMESPLYL